MTSTRRLVDGGVALAAVVCVVAFSAACSPADDEAQASPVVSQSPSPSPTLDEAESLQAAHVETAKQLVVDYRRAVDEVGAGADQEWEGLAQYWGGDFLPQMTDSYTTWEQQATRSTGETVVVSQELVEYSPVEGRETVTLDVCLDFSAKQGFTPDGAEIDLGDVPRRYMARLVVMHQTADFWTIQDEDPRTEEPC